MDISIRRLAEREHNITHWTEHDRCGHFATLETPDLLTSDIRTFFKPLAEAGYDVDALIARHGKRGRPTLGASAASVESVRLRDPLAEIDDKTRQMLERGGRT